MQKTTLDATRAILESDQSLSPLERRRLVALLRDGGTTQPASTLPRIVRRVEAARMLGRTLRGVDALAEAGYLPRVTLPGRIRSAGFRERDVVALIEGIQ